MSIYSVATLGAVDNQIRLNDFTTNPVYRVTTRTPQRFQLRQDDIPVPFESGIDDFKTLIGETVYIIKGVMYPQDEGSYDSGLAALRAVCSLDLEQDDPNSDNGYVPYTWGESSGSQKTLFVKPLYVNIVEDTHQGFVQPFTIFCKVKDPIIYGDLKTASTANGVPVLQQTITNLIPNPSFETNTTGWNAYHSATLSQSAAQVYVGTKSLSVVTTGGGVTAQGASINVTGLTSSTTYVFSAYLYMTSGISYTLELDSAINGSFSRSFTTTGSGTSGWQRISLSVTLSSSENELDCFIYTTSSTTFYLDAVQLEANSSPTAYFDGNSTSNLSNTYAWTGTANNSTSTNAVYQKGASIYAFKYPVTFGATYYATGSNAINDGKVPSYPISIDIYGPITNPKLTNTTTGEFISINQVLNSTADVMHLEYNNTKQIVTLNGNSILNHVTTDSTYWKIKPSVNTFSLSGSSIGSGAYAVISYRSGFALA